jgi:tripartite-type tricarboxylate transporter receptor subunit TctC
MCTFKEEKSMRKLAWCANSLAMLLAANVVCAQSTDYPTRPIRMLVGFPAGGISDTLARTVGVSVANTLGQPVVVDNRAGAGGRIAAELLSDASPDGYTLMLSTAAPIVVAPALGQKLNFDPMALVPVAKLAESMVVLLAHPSLGLKSVKEMIAMAGRKPGALNYASPGIGTLPHLSGELLKSMANINVVHVPYKGAPAILPAQIAGEVMLSLVPLTPAIPQIKAGRLQALGVTGSKRSLAAPDIPTIAESGLPGFGVTLWYGVFAPSKTPSQIVNKLNQYFLKTIESSEISQRLLRIGFEPSGSSPADLGLLVRSESKLWTKVVKDAGIKVE